MREIRIYEKTGSFAGNKDVAKEIRMREILPVIGQEDKVVLNFKGVDEATQSFIHALISDVIRLEGVVVLDKIYFKECNSKIKKIISIVTEYMQEPS
ncbi:DUF4325 domain-containing protein [Candidatus Woesearchaeota archaeon]|nr:DUF4325 domain-containing protein [Candidatus Woesearchaeota archaeon]